MSEVSANPSRVFLPHMPSRYDHATGVRVPSIDFNPAREFGRLIPLVGCTGAFMVDEHLEDAVAQVADGMKDFEPQDFILCSGDVVLLAAAIAYASEINNGEPVRLLRWNRSTKRYHMTEVSL